MTETENLKPSNENNGGNKIILVIIVILLLLATNIFLLWQFFTKNTEIDTLTVTTHILSNQKDSLKADLDSTIYKLNTIQSDNEALKGKLTETETQLEQKKSMVENMIRSGELVKAKQALALLKKDIETYKNQVDSLKKENLVLQQTNINLTTNLDEEKSKNTNLAKENSNLNVKVAAGSILKASVSKVIAVKAKANGKEIEVSRTKAAQKIKVCFTLLENRIVEAGTKPIFLRVIGPNGNVLTSNKNIEVFKINGQPSKYSAKSDVVYENKDVDVCMYYTSQNSTYSQNNNDLVKGDYKIEIYSEGVVIGKSQLSLK